MVPVLLKSLKKGDYFQLKDDYNAPLYVRNHYVRGENKISISPYDDLNKERFVKPDKIVFV